MVLVVVVAEVISHAVQLQQLDQNQIGMNMLQGRNLRSIQVTLCEVINLVAVQHQVRGEGILLMQDNVLVLDARRNHVCVEKETRRRIPADKLCSIWLYPQEWRKQHDKG